MADDETPQQHRFRVKHSSGEAICDTLDEARLLQKNKPGSKIFLDRQW